MTFLHPLGLLGLIGIPILIIIYIIKTQYTEQTISSTFLWTLSEKFLKKKNPISKIAGIISLILQVLSILVLSLAIAHPIITIPDSAQEYCLILDTSASMSMSDGESTRLERAKGKVKDVISDATDGSIYTLIVVGDTTVTAFERLESKKQAYSLIDEVEASHAADSLIDAVSLAQSYFDENSGLRTYLFTDKEYLITNNVTVINVASNELNTSISDLTYGIKDGTLTVKGNLLTSDGSQYVSISLYVDGSEVAAYTGLFAAETAKTPFELFASAPNFKSLEIVLEVDDALSLDNRYVIFNKESESLYSTLIVSERPFFIEQALNSVMESSVTVISPKEYNAQAGYGLYVFDSFSPDELPRDGAVWFINPVGTVKDSGFSYQSEVELENGGVLSLSTSSSSIAKRLRNELIGDEISLSAYVKCGLYKEFTTLYSYQGNPVIFAGTNAYGNREAVFAMDLHKSDIALKYDYSVIMRNLVEYSFPDIIEKTGYTVEDTLEVNVVANCDSIRIDTPSGEVKYLDTSGAISEYKLTEVGSYTVTVTVARTPRIFNVFAEAAESERATMLYANEISILGQAENGGFDGKFDMMTLLFVLLAVLFFADWGVYCYEKHQLR